MAHRNRPRAIGAIGLGACIILLASACGVGSPTATQPRACDSIPEDIGGCSPGRPVFAGTTCMGLAVEWGRSVDAGLRRIIDGPATVGGEGRSVLVSDWLVLNSILVGMRIRELGLLAGCDVPGFLPIAREQFSDGLDADILDHLYDGDPATAADWTFVLNRAISVIDADDGFLSPGPTGV